MHKVCKLLSMEETTPAAAGSSRKRPPNGRPRAAASPHGLQKSLAALLSAVFIAVIASGWLILRSPVRKVPDRRLGADYEAREATDAIYEPESRQLSISTKGDGVHALNVQTGFFEQHTVESTAGGLLADDVMQLDRDGQGGVYFLCTREGARGLCRLSSSAGEWKTLLGLDRFPELTDESNPPVLTAVAQSQGRLWIATDRCGIGVYHPGTHTWENIFHAAGYGLLSDRVSDLLRADVPPSDSGKTSADGEDAAIWIATAAGINHVAGGKWERFEYPAHLAGPEVRRLFWNGDKLWYATAGGGLGTFDGSGWQTIAGESRWGQYGDADVVTLCYHPGRRELWLVSADRHVGRYDLATRTWTGFDAPHGDARITAVACHETNQGVELLAASSKGLLCLDVEEGKWSTLGLAQKALQSVDAGDELTAVVAAPAEDRRYATAHVLLSEDAEGQWMTVVGPGEAKVGPKGALTAALSDDGNLLHVATELGISSYDLASHEWVADVEIADDKDQPRGQIVDLVAGPTPGRPEELPVDEKGGRLDPAAKRQRLLVLTADGSVTSWDGRSAQGTALAGGGRFPGDLASVTAVTRDRQGWLWLAAGDQIHQYDPQTRRWTPVPDCPTDIRGLQAARNGVWILAAGKAYFSGGGAPQPLEDGPQGLVRLFASPDADGAVAMDGQGRVFRLFDVARHQLLVGESAEGLDFKAVSAIGVAGDKLLLGGPRPYLYDAAHRSWTPLEMPAVTQIVAAFGQLWLRTETGGVYRFAPSQGASVDASPESSVVWLDGQPQRLVALGDDGRIFSAAADGGGWSVVKSAAQGPSSDVFDGGDAVVLADGEDLYLAGGSERKLWGFAWSSQTWRTIPADGGSPLEGVTQLVAGGARLFALVGGTGSLYSFSAGQAAAAREPLGDVRQLRAAGGLVVVTDARGTVHQFENGRWNAVLGAFGQGLPAGMAPRHAVETEHGLLLAGSNRAAVLAPSLSTWAPVDGSMPIDRLIADSAGKSIWAVSNGRSLFRLAAKQGGAWAWTPVQFGQSQSAVKSVTVGAGPNNDQHWACLDDGSVYQILGTAGQLWHRPTAAPQGAADVVGVAAAKDRFLVAFRGGSLSYCIPGTLSWSAAEAPSVSAISRFLGSGPADAPQGYWLLDGEGGLHHAPVAAPLQWKQVAAEVDDVAAAGQDLLAALSGPAELRRFDVTGRPTALFGPSRVVEKLADLIIAAGEIDVAADHWILVVSDGAQLQAYDPHTRTWSGQKSGLKELLALRSGLVGRDEGGQIHRVGWTPAGLALTPIATSGKITRLATTGEDDRILAHSDRGQLLLLTPDGQVDQLTGEAILPEAARRSKVRSLAAVDGRLFVSFEDGSLYAYDLDRRHWARVEGIAEVKEVLSSGGALWVEAGGAASRLLRIDCGQSLGKPEAVAQSPMSWELAAGGIVARFRTGQRVGSRYFAVGGDSFELGGDRPEGPESSTVVGAVATRHGVWMRTREDALWHYAPAARQWSQIELPKKAHVDAAALHADRPVIHTDQQDLLCGVQTTGQPQWQFEPRGSEVSAFDADGSRLAYVTAGRLVVDTLAGAAPAIVAQRPLSGARSDEGSKLRAAIGVAQTLWLANDAGKVAGYDLSKRAWRHEPDAPWPVDRFLVAGGRLHALGPDRGLAALGDQEWVAATRSADSWSDPEGKYTIDDAGRLLSPQADPNPPEPPRSISSAPVRVHSASGRVWIEMAGGGLWCYTEAERRLAPVVEPPADGSARLGLITAAGATYFVAAEEGRIALLDPEQQQPRWLELPRDVEVKLVRLLGDGLLLIGDEAAVTVRGDQIERVENGEKLESLRKAATTPGDRHLASGRWRLAPGDGDAGRRLEWKIGEAWHAAHLSPDAGRLAWDVATEGLSWQGQVYVATKAGIAVYPRGAAGPPTALYPIAGKDEQPPELAIWAIGDEYLFVGSADGRFWRLGKAAPTGPAVLEAISAPQSAWEVNESDQQIEFAVHLGPDADTSLPISIDAHGRLGIDRVNGVAWLGDSLFVGTDDAVLEYSADLAKVTLAQPGRTVDLCADRLRSVLLVRTSDERVQTFDGHAWGQSDQEAFDKALGGFKLRNCDPEADSIELDVDFGSQVGQYKVPYRKRSFAHDEPTAAPGQPPLTSDGQRVYMGTSIGLVVEDRAGRIVSIHPMEKGAARLRWLPLDGESASLYVLGGDEVVYELREDELVRAELTASELASRQLVRCRHNAYRWEVTDSGRGATIEPLSPEAGEAMVLDLDAGGFRRDQLADIGLSRRAAWAVAGRTVERIPLDPSVEAADFPLGEPDTSAADAVLRFKEGRLLAEWGGRAYELSETDEPALLPADAKPADASTGLFLGSHWKVTNSGGRAYVYYRPSQGQWMRLGFQAGFGMVIDAPRKVAAASGLLVLDTFAGLFMAPLPGPGQRLSLDAMVPLTVEGRDEPPAVDEFRVSSRDAVWARIADAWYQLDPDKKLWVRHDSLPGDVAEERGCLCETSFGRWTRDGDQVHLLEQTPSGPADSALDPAGRFDAGFVLAVWQEEQTLWALTRGGLRQLDLGTRRLNGMGEPGQFEADEGSFRAVNGQWLLDLAKAGQRRVFRRANGAWQPLGPTEDPSLQPPMIGSGRLRAVRDQQAALSFKIRPHSGDDTWELVAYLVDEGRFDFQVANDAAAFQVANDAGAAAAYVHVLTKAGMTTWKRGAAGLEFADLRRDLTAIQVSPDGSSVLCVNRQGGLETFNSASGWSTATAPEEDAGLLAQSSRWRCRQAAGTPPRLEVHADGQWVSVALHPAGDFEYRRPGRVALCEDGTAWTASDGMLVQYSPGSSGAWPVGHLTPPEALDSSAAGGFTDLLSIKGRPHVLLGSKPFALTDATNWSEAKIDPAAYARRGEDAANGWSWQRSEDGDLKLGRQLAENGPFLILWSWDATSGRFAVDTVRDVALDSNTIWLATAGGLVGADPSDGRTLRLLDPGVADWQRFAEDRRQHRLLLAKDPAGKETVSVTAASGSLKVGPAVPADESGPVFQAAYRDEEWHWQLGERPAVRWRSIPTGLTGGRFTHDCYQAMARDGSNLWLLSPVALELARADADSLPVVDAIALPEDVEPGDVVPAQGGAIGLLCGDGITYRYEPAGGSKGAWNPAAETPGERVLVDTDFWTWTRSPASGLKVRLKAADVPALDPALETDGRFAFDHVTSVLTEGPEVWIAGQNGIARRSVSDGNVRYWYRQQATETGHQPLGPIVELGRFDREGDPMPSCASAEQLETAALFARGADGRAWKFVPGTPGSWQAVDASPWDGPRGRWLVRTPSVEVSVDAGSLRLGYRRAQPLRPGVEGDVPVLRQGRFLADVADSVGFIGESTYMATPAGVVELDRDGSYQRLWALADGDPAGVGAHGALISHKADGALYFVHGADSAFRFHAEQETWEEVPVDEKFRESAEVLFGDSFWIWSRWGDSLHVRLLKAQESKEEWPLLADGRFSFDVLKRFHITGDRLWATTAGGVVEFDRRDMSILSIDRVATDADTGAEVSMREGEHFSRQEVPTVYGDRCHFTRRQDGWVRELGGRPAAGLDREYVDGRLKWTLGRLAKERGGGLDVQLYRGDVQYGSYQALRDVPQERLRKLVAADGRLWFCLDHGLYCLEPR